MNISFNQILEVILYAENEHEVFFSFILIMVINGSIMVKALVQSKRFKMAANHHHRVAVVMLVLLTVVSK